MKFDVNVFASSMKHWILR